MNKFLKIASLAIVLMMLAGTAPIYAEKYDYTVDTTMYKSHISGVKDNYVKNQGDKFKIEGRLTYKPPYFFNNGLFNIKRSIKDKLKLQILDSNGNIIYQHNDYTSGPGGSEVNGGHYKFNINTSDFAPGEYKIRVYYPGGGDVYRYLLSHVTYHRNYTSCERDATLVVKAKK